VRSPRVSGTLHTEEERVEKSEKSEKLEKEKSEKKLKRKSATKSPREGLSSRQKSLPDKKSGFSTPGKIGGEKPPKTEKPRPEKKSVRTTVSGLFSPRRTLTLKKIEHDVPTESPPNSRKKSISLSPPPSPRNAFNENNEKSPPHSPQTPKSSRGLHRSMTKNESKTSKPLTNSSSGGKRNERFSLPQPFNFPDDSDHLAT